MLVPFMLALAGIQIIKKPFFAMERRGALIAVGAIGVCLTAGLGLWLSPTLGVDGLALALSVSTVLQFTAYLLLLRGMVSGGLGLGALIRDVARLTVATLPAVGAAWFIIDMGHWESGPTLTNAAVLGAAGVAGGILYGIAATALGVKELQRVVERVRERIG
jgi:peptidoglycan biosynthesis protein MviN/MurJ (putative lipid II flippase)